MSLQILLGRIPLLRKVKEIVGLSHPSLTGKFTLDQLRQSDMLHPSLSSLEVSMHDSEGRDYKLIYRVDVPFENVPDTERNLPSLEFRTASKYDSQVRSFVDEPAYDRIDADINLAIDKQLSHKRAKTHDKKAIKDRGGNFVKDYTQVTTLLKPLTCEEIIILVDMLPIGITDKQNLVLSYHNIRNSVYRQAIAAKLPLTPPAYAK